MVTKLIITRDECPCGSKKIIKNCECYSSKTKTLHRKSIIIGNGASTYKNPKCYASPISGCSEKISKEHFFSKAIIKKFSPIVNAVKISGFPWQKDSFKTIPLSAFQSKILCVTHNNALSKLDEVGLDFYSAYAEVFSLEKKKENYKKIYLFNGYDVEKWMLKCGFGYLFSKNLQFKGKRVSEVNYPPDWLLQILFSNSHLPGTRGMYLVGDVGQAAVQGGVTINMIARAISSPQLEIIDGYEILLNGLLFVLALDNPPLNTLKNTTYRPSELIFRGSGGRQIIIKLSWGHGKYARKGGLVFNAYEDSSDVRILYPIAHTL